ncbi:MAG: helix-turn-helix transcriptional regulator [Rhodospirillales bacterium]|nr:helix-turn-helix transcriptional regulator [Rhodospirillales bacterium]
MPDTVDAINPLALKAARKRLGLSQQQLADTIRCTKDTISRWERGTSSRVRSHLRGPLCKTLQLSWEQLTSPADQTSDAFAALNPTVRVSIAEHARAALQLVAERYKVRPQDVLDIAPLLFAIVAERSLQEREQRLHDLRDAIAFAEGELSEHFQHLGGVSVAARDSDGEDPLWEEEAALSERDVFGIQTHPEGPFIRFVRSLAKDLPKDAVVSIDPATSGSSVGRYRIADDTLRDITGITGEGEQDEQLLDHIRAGLISLPECLRVKRDNAELEYREWLSEELSRADAEAQRRLEEYWIELGLSPEAVQILRARGGAR